MSGREFQNVAEHRLGIGNPKECQVLVERLSIDLRFNPGDRQQSLDLGRNGKTPPLLHVVERCNSEVIPSQKKRWGAGAQVANTEREHAIQALNAVCPCWTAQA